MFRNFEANRQIKLPRHFNLLRQISSDKAFRRHHQKFSIDVVSVDSDRIYHTKFANHAQPRARSAARHHNRFRRNYLKDNWKNRLCRLIRTLVVPGKICHYKESMEHLNENGFIRGLAKLGSLEQRYFQSVLRSAFDSRALGLSTGSLNANSTAAINSAVVSPV